MSKRASKRAKAMAQKAAMKKARYDRPQEQREKSRYAQRLRARHNGAPMSSRSGERPPWWDRGVRGSFGAQNERTAVSCGSRMM